MTPTLSNAAASEANGPGAAGVPTATENRCIADTRADGVPTVADTRGSETPTTVLAASTGTAA